MWHLTGVTKQIVHEEISMRDEITIVTKKSILPN